MDGQEYENDEVTGEQDNDAQVAAAPEVGALPDAQAATAQPDTPSDMVPLSALQEERRKRQMYEQMLLQQAQSFRAPQVDAQPQQSDILGEIGIRPEDLFEADGVRRFATGVQSMVEKKVQQHLAQFSQNQFLAEHGDFANVVGQTYGGQFVPSQQFQQACAADPLLRDSVNGLLSSGNVMAAMRLAYGRASTVGKQVQQFPQPGIEQQTAARIAPTSPTSVGGGGGGFGQAQRVGQMSDEEFDRLDRQVAAMPG